MTTSDSETVFPHIEAAQQDDLSTIRALLATLGLPEAGLEAHIPSALVARSNHGLVGCIALEVYGDVALLRSAAVAPAWQGRGLGKALTMAALGLARQRGVRAVYLLTDTAEDYFPKFGFRAIPRAEVHPTLHQSEEFQGACSDSAQAMVLVLPAQS